ncbi:hypothetical protein [Glaciihabitans sp. UYNi722]|uniref:hypothetical protein n=1 Tax=Glaciihabitans sp. UYNi722 TaxID=3156344 RepID=UPI00339AEEAC
MNEAQQSLVFVRDLRLPDDTRHQHARSAAVGREVRVARGVYIDRESLRAMDSRRKYLARVRAIAETRRNRPVLSHWSAAAIHGLPMIGDWPSYVHITQPKWIGSRSRNGVIRHSLAIDDSELVEIHGMLVTSVVRTVLDLAAIASTISAVAAADAALHSDRFDRHPPLATQDDLHRAWEQRLPFRGHARALDIVEFATTAADTPIESVSRVNMRVIGCPPPQLQTPYFDGEGFIGETDFSWQEYGAIGEADGDLKYLDEAYRGGRSAERVVLDEKTREDRLRALPRAVARWRWNVAINPRALRSRLVPLGLPMKP